MKRDVANINLNITTLIRDHKVCYKLKILTNWLRWRLVAVRQATSLRSYLGYVALLESR